jgi:DNA-directed RNA polymerase specialized sigma24 family protein
VLERVRASDEAERRTAFGDLADGYWRPSYHYLRLHWRLTPQEAEDLVQGFFAVAFEKRYLDRYDPAKARFRTFLRLCLDRYVQNERKAAQADKRGGRVAFLALDFPDAERELGRRASADPGDVERFFHDEFVRALFTRAVDRLRRELVQAGREQVFLVFERHDLNPPPDVSYAAVARAHSLTTSQVTNFLHTARRRFRDLVLEELRALTASDDEWRDEARELFGIEIAP